MAGLTLRGIGKTFGDTAVLNDIDLDIADGEFLTLVGPSGCGKSTLLRIIAGLESQDRGSVSIGGTSVDHLRPHERRIAMVFQNYALYPHMSVFDNIALPLTMTRLNLFERLPLMRHLSLRRRRVIDEIAREVRAVAEQLRIDTFFHRRPGQLSGGQRQRVALGRAMVRHPQAFLMDEPLSNLDAKLRVHMRGELTELHARLGATMVYVTHDQIEAMTMSDRLAVMDHGDILQLGTPAEVYERPATTAVAQFIGSPAINLFPACVGPDGRVELLGRTLPIDIRNVPAAELTIGVRPEAMRIGGGPCTVPCRFRRRENLGSESILHFDLVTSPEVPVLCRIDNDMPVPEGEVTLAFEARDCHVFDNKGRRIEVESRNAAGRDARRASEAR
ncbi:ABC transporter ATP-binding protein [Bradyrhizobium diazoefficiens]|uniref:ABC transporter ATP-binding protein n=1 Tax=Bradyrhizobium sp. WYCCWR 12699 TaxID=3064203 RepID=UPI001B8A01DA|nr:MULTISPECIES: ABC transporter ATP-binding protein [Bradyrhizobium]MBR0699676.1 ABC transporter ATP-binding protein [Bradyrhizobium diazoefficiens]MBR0768011.1 ABC transporter ATP-binding protein [Bradyrhizobium diazoefficiens]MBR0928418.1 ABC transporter ATP-binding protein [Bradyrhizobium diazoefficiens]MDT4736323.1 ABC transporter ATP-binding protein [Bradyrhizobium sp. WYCCWR 12699]